jgi:exopolysaccharide production protein ExoZ
MVVLSHATSTLIDRHLSDVLPRWITGHAGVDIFFVISGFVMLLTSEPLRTRPGGWRYFLLRRLIRIVPLYWLALTLKVALVYGVPSVAAHPQISISHLVSSYLFLPALAPPGVEAPFMAVGWTLNYEMLFYTLCTAALFFGASPVRFVGIVLSSLIAFGLVHPTGTPFYASYTNPIVIEFIFGMFVALLARRRPQAHWIICLAVIVGGFVVISLAVVDPIEWRALIWGVPAMLVLLGVTTLEDTWRRIIPPVLLLLGDSSYALYLVHTFVVPAVVIVCAMAGLRSPWMIVVICVSVSIGLSVVIHLRLELPITEWLKRALSVSSRRRPAR